MNIHASPLLLKFASMGVPLSMPPSIAIGDCLLLEHRLQCMMLDDSQLDEQRREGEGEGEGEGNGEGEGEGEQRQRPSSTRSSPSSFILCETSPPSHVSPRAVLFHDSRNISDCSITRLTTSSPPSATYMDRRDSGDMIYTGDVEGGDGLENDSSTIFSPLNLQPLHVNRNCRVPYTTSCPIVDKKDGNSGLDDVEGARDIKIEGVSFRDISSIMPDESTTRVSMERKAPNECYDYDDIGGREETDVFTDDNSLLDSQAIMGTQAPLQEANDEPRYQRKPLNLMTKQYEEEMNSSIHSDSAKTSYSRGFLNNSVFKSNIAKLVKWIQSSREKMLHRMIQYTPDQREDVYSALLHGCCTTGSLVDKSNPGALCGGILIITSKPYVDVWAGPIRGAKKSFSDVSLEVYIQPLPVRRKLGVSRLSNYDVVITTFDVLKAKEVVIPESDARAISLDEDTDKENNNQRNVNKGDSIQSDPWLKSRRRLGCARGSLMLELCQLHLVKWNTVIVDINSQTAIKGRNAKGLAVKALEGGHMIGMAEHNEANILALRDLLKVPLTSPSGIINAESGFVHEEF